MCTSGTLSFATTDTFVSQLANVLPIGSQFLGKAGKVLCLLNRHARALVHNTSSRGPVLAGHDSER